jgi:hypothetical protein
MLCAGFFVLYLQFENHILGPLIVGRSVKLSPPATMTAALIGVSAGGVVGALLAVPVVASAKVVYLELRRPPPEPHLDRFTEAAPGDGSGVSETDTDTGPTAGDEPEVTSVPLEDEDGNTYVIAQQNSGSAETTDGGGEFPDPDAPPQAPAPGAAE